MAQRNGFYVYWSGSRATASGENTVGQGMTYQYDDFNRLSGMKNSSGQTTYTYVYDRYGNRVQQNALQGGSGFNPSYNAATNQLISSNSVNYTYDAAGNMTYDAYTNHQFTYDAEGNILQVDAGQSTAWSFVFDALNHRVRAQYSGGVSEAVFDLAGRITSGYSGPTTPSESHIFADSQQLAYRSGDGHTYFVHQNWLGTDRVHTDQNGATAATYTSLPFGDGGSENVSEGYAGWDFEQFGSLDVDFWDNTYHAQFRNYSELQGRWTSPDPYDGSYDLTNPQTLNRYSYSANNPLSMKDPSGLDDCNDLDCDGNFGDCDPFWGDCDEGGWGGSGDGSISSLQPEFKGWKNLDPNKIWTEKLGIPANMKLPSGDILSIFGIDSSLGCEFGACGGGYGFQSGAAAIPAAVACAVAEPCGTIAGVAAIVGMIGYDAYTIYSKGGRQRVEPSWASGERPRAGESASEFADRVCKAQYPPSGAGCGTGPTSERNRIRKWARDKWGI